MKVQFSGSKRGDYREGRACDEGERLVRLAEFWGELKKAAARNGMRIEQMSPARLEDWKESFVFRG